MWKLFVLSVLFMTCVTYVDGQNMEQKYEFNARLNLGFVANSSVDGKFAYGGSFETLIRMNEFGNVPMIVGTVNPGGNPQVQMLTFGLKLMSNPFSGSPFLVTTTGLNKNGSDAFNYAMLLAGYRFAFGIGDYRDQWVYVEPRLGLGLSSGFRWAGLAFSPAAGYLIDRFDIQIFIDAGIGSNGLSIKSKSFVTPGVGVAYTF